MHDKEFAFSKGHQQWSRGSTEHATGETVYSLMDEQCMRRSLCLAKAIGSGAEGAQSTLQVRLFVRNGTLAVCFVLCHAQGNLYDLSSAFGCLL